jgi:hypothetical protein
MSRKGYDDHTSRANIHSLLSSAELEHVADKRFHHLTVRSGAAAIATNQALSGAGAEDPSATCALVG